MTGGAFRWPEVLSPGRGGTLIRVRVRPNAGREGIDGASEGHLLVRVTVPPAEGKANRALLRVLAGELGIPPSRLEVVKGERGRNKVVLARGWPG